MSEIQTYKFYAGNKWHDPSSEKYFESEDPSIGKVWARIPDCNEKDINPVSYTHLTLPTKA